MRRSGRARTLGWSVLALAAAWFGLEAQATSYDFSYRLSGDRRVAPIQVFDDGRQTWLQFAPGQVMPAVFVQQADKGLQLADYQQQGPYLVLQGTAGQIDLRIGDIMARAEYTGTVARQPAAVTVPASAPAVLSPAPHPSVSATHPAQPTAANPARPTAPASAVNHSINAAAASPAIGGAIAPLASAERAAQGIGPASSASVRRRHEVSSPGASAVPGANATATAGAAAPLGVPVTAAVSSGEAALEFDAALSDRNMRRVLERWARQVGWTFQPEHWTVDVDIPLVGAASFGADFRNAVRGLLAATELGERPLQPCFYSNRVLRVIAFSQACDRTAAPVVLAERG